MAGEEKGRETEEKVRLPATYDGPEGDYEAKDRSLRPAYGAYILLCQGSLSRYCEVFLGEKDNGETAVCVRFGPESCWFGMPIRFMRWWWYEWIPLRPITSEKIEMVEELVRRAEVEVRGGLRSLSQLRRAQTGAFRMRVSLHEALKRLKIKMEEEYGKEHDT